jgi:hypothetical protein
MVRLSRLYRPVIWRADNTSAQYVDGTGVHTASFEFHGGYARLGHFVDSLQAVLHTSPQMADAGPTNRTAWFIGNAAQSMNLWSQAMPDLPAITVTDALLTRLLDAFPGANGAQKADAYRTFVKRSLREYVLLREARTLDEQANASKRAALAAIEAELSGL